MMNVFNFQFIYENAIIHTIFLSNRLLFSIEKWKNKENIFGYNLNNSLWQTNTQMNIEQVIDN